MSIKEMWSISIHASWILMRIIKKYQVTLYSNDEKKVKQFFANMYLTLEMDTRLSVWNQNIFMIYIIVLYLEDNQLCNE